MGKLIFDDVAAVKELYDHAKRCTVHRKAYGEPSEPGLWLVHDQGVYLMSPGIPHLAQEDEPEGNKVVYARGCDPKKDKEWWDESHDLVGGDDFVEPLPIEAWDELFGLKTRLLRIEIRVGEDSFQLVAIDRVPQQQLEKLVGARELDDIV